MSDSLEPPVPSDHLSPESEIPRFARYFARLREYRNAELDPAGKPGHELLAERECPAGVEAARQRARLEERQRLIREEGWQPPVTEDDRDEAYAAVPSEDAG